MIAVMLERPDITTLLLGLDLIDRYTDDQRIKAEREGNHVTVITMNAMAEHVAELRAKLRAVAS